jgi:hypothetical protein
MISLQDSVRYIGLTIVIWCLLKALGSDMSDMSNPKTIFLLVAIVFVVLLLTHRRSCDKKEEYQMTAPPVVDSIYPQRDNTDTKPDKEKRYMDVEYEDADIKDFKDIMAIDKKTYKKILDNEQNAMDAIQKKHTNEMVYTTTNPFNTVPLGTQLYGYTYLPPENWFRAYERPPVCVTEQKCPVCPISGSSTADLMQFDTSNNIAGPTGIDLRYVKRKLNKEKN